ncbi:MAG: L-threonylcarbamoyladenylate synthase [Paracoccus sp. (in: a-proteobacteria)]|nr:L-threonylcarbamoyladenylate synthase [Paracoccus sp. (in: a-proteobacteria)]
MTDPTPILPPEAERICFAAMQLARGRLVGMPTETVYGLAADATNAQAVAAIYAAKGRPAFNPLIVHAPDLAVAERFAHFDAEARALAQAFWPGPLTLVRPLRQGSGLASLVTAGLDTVALRVPAHPVAQSLLRAFEGVVAAPSANPSGRISPTTAQHVIDGLDGKLAAVLDAGPCTVGVESTIIGWREGQPTLLRPGGLPAEAIEAALGRPLARLAASNDHNPDAPGQLSSHYAPRAALRMNATAPRPAEYLIGFGDVAGDDTLSESADLTEAAARLFDVLHRADHTGQPIAVAPIPDHGLGRAINDRLRRAAAPR